MSCLTWSIGCLYYVYISTIKKHVMVNQKFANQNEFLVWYDQLGHPRCIMMRKKSSKTHVDTHLRVKKLLQTNEFSWTICSQKLIMRPSPEKLKMSQSHFKNEYIVIFVVQYTYHVEHLYISWFSLMHQVDSHICLLSTHNQVIAKLLVQLRVHFPDYLI